MTLFFKTKEVEGVKYIEMNDKGQPLVVNDQKEEGSLQREFGLDALSNFAALPKLREEAKVRRESLEALQTKVGILSEHDIELDNLPEWVPQALGAIETVANFDQKKLVDAKEVDEIKKQAAANLQRQLDDTTSKFQKKIKGLETSGGEKDTAIYGLMVADQFNNSKFVNEKLNMTARAALRYFKDNFKVEVDPETGKRSVIAYYDDASKVLSMGTEGSEFGDPASFEEALQILTDKDSDRDTLLYGAKGGGTGSGAGGGSGGGHDGPNPWAKDHINLTRQSEITREDPTRAALLKAQVGK